MKPAAIIILDDEVNVLNSLKRLFRDESFDVFSTTNYKEAIEKIDDERVKVVMSDQRMPQVSGVEFLKNVKDKNPSIVRILFTGYADIKIAEEAINKGEVYRFVNKPWNTEDLKVTVRQAIRKFDLEMANKKLMEEIKGRNNEVTLLNNKLKSLQETQRMFSITVSGDLKKYLTSIKKILGIILSKEPGALTKEQENLIDKAKNNVSGLEGLIDEILSSLRL